MITPNHKRIFCFGCSFTQWRHMPTWADILKHYYKDTKTVYNLGRAGAGNYYIFNKIVETSLEYNFTKDDLILIQWSGVLREDRFKDGGWHTPGNILHQDIYSKSVVDKWFFDEEGMIKRDYSYIHATQKILEANNIDYEMFSMNDLRPVSEYGQDDDVMAKALDMSIDEFYELAERVGQEKYGGLTRYNRKEVMAYIENHIISKFDFEPLYEDTMSKLHPSMYEIMWGTENVPLGVVCAKTLKHGPDSHPLPSEHLLYLEKVFKIEDDELRTYVDKITKEFLL